jgi:hypothetical protein
MLPVCVLLAYATPNGMPEDVSRFTEQRDRCDTLRGELSGDGAENGDAVGAINQFCKGTDKALAALLERYSKDKRVMDRLQNYERRIEAD